MSGQDYQVDLGDGRSVVVNAANPAEARNAAQNFLMREKGDARGKAGGVDNFVRSLARGAALGGADEFAAAGDATAGPLVDKITDSGTSNAPSWSERYSQNLEAERAQDRAYDKEHPILSTTGKIIGGIGGAAASLPKFLTSAPTFLRSALTGAGIGGVTGFNEGEGGFDDRLKGAGEGALVGGLLGGAIHPLAKVGGTIGNAILESGLGRMVSDKVVTPGMRVAADTLDFMAPKRVPASLSAAAPEGGSGLPSGFLADAADSIRAGAPTAPKILDDAAARRIADALQRGGGDPSTLAAQLQALGPGAMIADIDPMATRLTRTAYISPGSAPRIINEAMEARNRATGTRLTDAITDTMGDNQPAVLEAQNLQRQRSTQGRSDYDAGVGPDAPFNVSPEMRDIMQSAPSIQRAMDTIEANARDNGVSLTPAQVAHRVKQQLNLDADAAFASGKAVNKADVGDIANRWRTALHDANPAIKAADEAWEANTAKMDALDLGRKFMQQGVGEVADAVSPAILAQRIPNMSPEEAQAFIAGAADTMTAKAQSGLRPARQVAGALDENANVRSKLITMLGPQKAARLFSRAAAERTFANTDRVVRGGSDTASKSLSALDDAASAHVPVTPHSMASRVLSKMVDAYNRGRAGNEDVRGRIAQMLTNTDAEAHADTLDRIAAQLSMIQRGRPVRSGLIIGANQE